MGKTSDKKTAPKGSSRKAVKVTRPVRASRKKNERKSDFRVKSEWVRSTHCANMTFLYQDPFRQDALKDHRTRLEGITDDFTRQAIEYAEGQVESAIRQALENTGEWTCLSCLLWLIFFSLVRIDIDYKDIAIHQDKVGTPINRRRLNLPKKVNNTLLHGQQGAAIEDRNGTLIAIRLPSVLDFVHVSHLTSKIFLFLFSLLGPHCPSRTNI